MSEAPGNADDPPEQAPRPSPGPTGPPGPHEPTGSIEPTEQRRLPPDEPTVREPVRPGDQLELDQPAERYPPPPAQFYYGAPPSKPPSKPPSTPPPDYRGPDPAAAHPGQQYAAQQYPGYGPAGAGHPAGYGPGGAGYGGPPTASRGPARVDLRPGPRTRRRPDARFGPSLAAAGAAMAVIGLLIWTGGYYVHGVHSHFDFDTGAVTVTGEGRKYLGAALFTLLAAGGYALTFLRRTGPLATAGTLAGVVSVPIALVFWTLDLGGAVHGKLPLNIDLVYLVSIVIWLVSYFAVPGARGRSVYLGSAATGLVTYIATKSASHDVLGYGSAATNGGGLVPGATRSATRQGRLRRSGWSSGWCITASPRCSIRCSEAAPPPAWSTRASSPPRADSSAPPNRSGRPGIGVALVLIGALLAFYGGRANRRFTAWVWSAAVVLGAIVLIAEIPSGKYAIAGIVLAVIGIAVAIGAQLLIGVTREPPDLDEEALAGPR